MSATESEEGSGGAVAAAVDKLAVPIYNDALQPAVKEIGKALAVVTRAVNVVLLPLKALVWGADRITDYVEKEVPKRLAERNVPPERIIPPNPDIAVPALEAMRYSALRDQYANLLATAMDRNTAHEAHPAFVEILKQLVPDEARILQYLPRGTGRAEPLMDLSYEDPQRGRFLVRRHLNTLGEDAGCEIPELAPRYIDNLCRLGLTEVPSGYGLYEDWRYGRIREHAVTLEAMKEIPEGREFELEPRMVGLTELGGGFIRACIATPQDAPGDEPQESIRARRTL